MGQILFQNIDKVLIGTVFLLDEVIQYLKLALLTHYHSISIKFYKIIFHI